MTLTTVMAMKAFFPMYGAMAKGGSPVPRSVRWVHSNRWSLRWVRVQSALDDVDRRPRDEAGEIFHRDVHQSLA